MWAGRVEAVHMQYCSCDGVLLVELLLERGTDVAMTRLCIRSACRATRTLPQATRLASAASIRRAERVLRAWAELHRRGYARRHILLMGAPRRHRTDDTPVLLFA